MINRTSRVYAVFVVCIAVGLAGCSHEQIQQAQEAHQQSESHVAWSGDVDDGATVYIQGAKTWVDNVTAKPVQNAVGNFQGVLPNSDGVTVNLESKTGRGTVEIVQQPTKDNNYTAAVRILDSAPGADHYKFVLTW